MPTTAPLKARSLLAAALLCCACDRASEIAYDDPPDTVHSIAHLRSLCTGASVPVREPIVIRGTVTGNDRFGEFPKMLVVQDRSGGIVIDIEHAALADDYPFGACITVYCNGLVLNDYGGNIRLGTAPGDYGPGRIPRADTDRYIRCEAPAEAPPEPVTLTFGEVSMRHVDTYVRFERVTFTQSGSWCDRDPVTGRMLTTEREIADPTGRTLRVRTDGGCIYASESLPSGTGSITGILDYFNGKYVLRVVNRDFSFVSAATPPTTYPSAGRYSAPTPTR